MFWGSCPEGGETVFYFGKTSPEGQKVSDPTPVAALRPEDEPDSCKAG